MGIDHPTAKQVSTAVIRIRQRKLPDPRIIGNAGSFFKNPIVSRESALELQKHFADLPMFFGADEMVKLSAAWMIEQCGWKGQRKGDAGVSEQHALVLVNHGNASGQQLYELACAITDSVSQRFDIDLKPEPKIIH